MAGPALGVATRRKGNEMDIGDWIRREGGQTKWHHVESVVAGDAVTKCGRRMAASKWTAKTGRLTLDIYPAGTPEAAQLCKNCD